jgi:hypothetical protein
LTGYKGLSLSDNPFVSVVGYNMLFYVLFYSLVFGGSEFHEMNNQNRQVPLDDYSPHEALQELAFLQAF